MATLMTETRFRNFMLVSLMLFGLAVAADTLAIVNAKAMTDQAVEWSGMVAFGIALLVVNLALCVVGFIGMFTFNRWGRTLSLIVTVFFPVLWIAFGALVNPEHVAARPLPSSDFSPYLLELATVAWGAVLALAYYSPVGSRFSASNSQI